MPEAPRHDGPSVHQERPSATTDALAHLAERLIQTRQCLDAYLDELSYADERRAARHAPRRLPTATGSGFDTR